MSDGGLRPGEVEPPNALLDGAITDGDTLMLPEMLHPGLDDEAFDVTSLLSWIPVDGPVDGAVAAADRLEVAEGLHKCVCPRRIDTVCELDPDGAIGGGRHHIEVRFRHVRLWGEV